MSYFSMAGCIFVKYYYPIGNSHLNLCRLLTRKRKKALISRASDCIKIIVISCLWALILIQFIGIFNDFLHLTYDKRCTHFINHLTLAVELRQLPQPSHGCQFFFFTFVIVETSDVLKDHIRGGETVNKICGSEAAERNVKC